MNIKSVSIKIWFFVLFLLVIVIYYPVLNIFFSQDDFFHFKVTLTDGSIGQLFNLLGFHPFQERLIAFYRPISRDLPYHIYYLIFGLNAYPFRVIQFLVLFLNIFLVYWFTKKVFKDKVTGLIASLIYAFGSVNISALYYIAGGIQTTLATTFIICSLGFFWDYLSEGKTLKRVLTFGFFLLAIGSHELAMVLPALLSIMVFYKYGLEKSFKIILKELWLYFGVLGVYLFLDLKVIGFSPGEKQYQLVFSIKPLINSLVWYLVWLIGIPEMLIDFLNPGFKLNPNLMKFWSNYFFVIFSTFFLFVISIFFILFQVFKKAKEFIFSRKMVFVLGWIFLPILILIFLPFHKSTHYLIPSLPGYAILLALIIKEITNGKYSKVSKVVLGIMVLSGLILNIYTIKLSDSTYWAANRGRVAQKLINQIGDKYSSLPKGASLYIKNDPNYPFIAKEWGGSSKQAYFILNGSDALRLYYRDPSLNVYYEDQQKPQDSENLFEITPEVKN